MFIENNDCNGYLGKMWFLFILNKKILKNYYGIWFRFIFIYRKFYKCLVILLL